MLSRFSFFVIAFLYPSFAFAGGLSDVCAYIAKTKKVSPTWGADYVAGVDVHGKNVTPADLNSGASVLPNPIIIPIEIDIASRYGIALPPDVEMKADILKINIFDDGRVTYNDQDITPNIKDICENFDKENVSGDGQIESDVVPSEDTIEGQYPEYNQ